MNDNIDNKVTSIRSESNEALNGLAWDITPDRDLWPDISSRIKFVERSKLSKAIKRKHLSWSNLAVAACLVMACAAVVMSSMAYYRTQQTHQMQASYIEYQKAQIALMEQQHSLVRAQFVGLLSGDMGELNATTAAEIQTVLMTFDVARETLKNAILEQPLNTKYPSKLANNYQQELKLLNKYKEHYKNDKTTI